MSTHNDAWIERWRDGRIGFHLDRVNGYLRRHADRILAEGEGRILVPLCGKSLDLAWLSARGHEVVGIELAQAAVDAFHTEHGLVPEVTTEDGFKVHATDRLRVLVGDFFDFRVGEADAFDAVWDRASMIALPVDDRRRYVAHLRTLLKPGAKILLSTLSYDQDLMDGPPYSVSADEVDAAYRDAFSIERLEEKDITDENPRFRASGLDRVLEETWLLESR